MKLKIDFHTHSHKSFDSVMSYKEIIESAKKRGLDGVCICDHACTDISESLKNDNDDFIIIPAMEITTGKNHIIGMFLENEPMLELNQKLAAPLEQIVEETHKKGGICILAHPFERMKEGKETMLRRADKVIKLVDGIETYNSRAPYKYSAANKLALTKANELNIICRTAGSDGHLPCEIGSAYCIVDTPSRSLEDIKNAVLAGKTEIVGKHCKRIYITKSELIKASKFKYPLSRKLKLYLSYPIRALADLFDVICGRKL